MKKIKAMLFLATLIAAATTTTLADGQIPIGGRPGYESTKQTIETTTTATNDAEKTIYVEISDYFWTIVSVINRF